MRKKKLFAGMNRHWLEAMLCHSGKRRHIKPRSILVIVALGNPRSGVGSQQQPRKNCSVGPTPSKKKYIKFSNITFQFCISILACFFDLLPCELHQEVHALTINSDNHLQSAACFENLPEREMYTKKLRGTNGNRVPLPPPMVIVALLGSGYR